MWFSRVIEKWKMVEWRRKKTVSYQDKKQKFPSFFFSSDMPCGRITQVKAGQREKGSPGSGRPGGRAAAIVLEKGGKWAATFQVL